MSRTLLLTRARPQAEEFAKLVLQNTDFHCHIAPMQKMQDIPAEIDFSGIDALVFTSKNGVERFARRWDIRNIPAYCVGAATAGIAQAAGMKAHAAAGNSASLAGLVGQSGARYPLHIHGKHLAGDLAIGGRDIAIYDQLALPLNPETTQKLAMGEIGSIALFSPRSALLLADIWQKHWPGPVFYCISAATGKPVKNLGEIRISAAPDASAMLDLLHA